MRFINLNRMFFDLRLVSLVVLLLFANTSFSQQTKITSTGSAGNYSITYPGYFTLVPGQEFTFEANHTNPGAATLTVNGTTSSSITKYGSVSLDAGEIVSGQMVKVIYDGTKYQMLSAPFSTGSSTSWSINGNSGLNSTTNFLGTTDGADLVFRTGNIERMRLNGAGRLGLGVATPLEQFHIQDANPTMMMKSTQSTSFASARISFGRDDGAGGFIENGYVGLMGGGDFLTVGSPQMIHFNTNYSNRAVLDINGNFGLNVGMPSSLLTVGGGATIGSGYATSVAPMNGLLIEGKVGIGTTFVNNDMLFLVRQSGVVGSGFTGINVQRSGNPGNPASGGGWDPGNIDAGIKCNSIWGNNYSAAIAGYNYLTDYDNSAAVIGADQGASIFGALAFRGAPGQIYAGYFNGKLRVTTDFELGNQFIVNSSPGNSGDILQSNGTGVAPSWVSSSSINAANKTLSNLNPTSINQSLNPNSNDNLSIGTISNSWKDLALDGRIYIDDAPFTGGNANNVFVGIGLIESLTSGNYNTGIGFAAGALISTGLRNTIVGHNAGQNVTTQSDNTLLGSMAGGLASSLGSENTFVGVYAGYQAPNSGGFNTFVGAYAGQANTSGSFNTYLGNNAGTGITSGANNVAIGRAAGNNVMTGSNNTFIGMNSGFPTATQRNKAVAIGYNSRIDVDNGMALGGTGVDAVLVGINVSAPTERLHVGGNIRLTGAFMPNNNAGGSGQVLTSAGAGLPPTWSTPVAYTATNGLNLSGSQFGLGGTLTQNTTVNMNSFGLYFTGTNSSLVGIKTITPAATLHVNEVSGGAQFRITNNITGETNTDGFSIQSGGTNNVTMFQHENADVTVVVNGVTTMSMKPTGFVGIGMTTPSERLEVSGNIEIPGVNEYKYATAKTKSIGVHNSAFGKEDESTTYVMARNGNIYLAASGGTTGLVARFVAPFMVPDGAVITSITPHFYDTDATYDCSIIMGYSPLSSTAATTLATVTSSSNTGHQYPSVATSITVDNDNNAYYLVFDTRQNTYSSPQLLLYTVKITYTVSKAD